jgi:prepilin-type processing-associated H-X9-DG protein
VIEQGAQDIYFAANRWLARPNLLWARRRYRVPERPEGHYLHLGSGATYIPGMINAEGNLLARKDLWLDLRNPLPFPDASVFFLYCSHTLEHFAPADAQRLLREMHRVLGHDGVVRLAVPSFEHALAVAAGEAQCRWPRDFDDPHAQAVNYLFCDGQHKYAYSFALLSRFAREAGFGGVEHYSAAHATAPKQYGAVRVGDEVEGSLVVELRR